MTSTRGSRRPGSLTRHGPTAPGVNTFPSQGQRQPPEQGAPKMVPGAGLEPARPQQGQRGLSSPCLHSTIRAGHGLRIGPPDPIGSPHPNCGVVGRCCLILLAPEGVSGHGNRHQHMPPALRARDPSHVRNDGISPQEQGCSTCSCGIGSSGGSTRPEGAPRTGPGSVLPAPGSAPLHSGFALIRRYDGGARGPPRVAPRNRSCG